VWCGGVGRRGVLGCAYLQALSGLIIASVIKYADNILKTFANAASILRKPGARSDPIRGLRWLRHCGSVFPDVQMIIGAGSALQYLRSSPSRF
jgi:hypothetical protein